MSQLSIFEKYGSVELLPEHWVEEAKGARPVLLTPHLLWLISHGFDLPDLPRSILLVLALGGSIPPFYPMPDYLDTLANCLCDHTAEEISYWIAELARRRVVVAFSLALGEDSNRTTPILRHIPDPSLWRLGKFSHGSMQRFVEEALKLPDKRIEPEDVKLLLDRGWIR